tara:strand:- start:82 stop:534 length:453 start_codon:yes stop_codon:yes gene_type:complete
MWTEGFIHMMNVKLLTELQYPDALLSLQDTIDENQQFWPSSPREVLMMHEMLEMVSTKKNRVGSVRVTLKASATTRISIDDWSCEFGDTIPDSTRLELKTYLRVIKRGFVADHWQVDVRQGGKTVLSIGNGWQKTELSALTELIEELLAS